MVRLAVIAAWARKPGKQCCRCLQNQTVDVRPELSLHCQQLVNVCTRQ